MSPAAAPRPVKAGTRRAWSVLAVAGTVVLITGVLIAAAGEALARGTERGTPPATVAGLLLAACGLACGAALIAAAAAGVPGAQRRPGQPGVPRPFRHRGAARRPAAAREPGTLGPLSTDGPAAAGPGSADRDDPPGGRAASGGRPEPAAPRGPFEPASQRGGPAAPRTDPPAPADPGPGGQETSEEWLRSLRPGGPPG
ncbi:MAG: hypothetical protein ACM32E_14840 [Gemmatimonadota bacterium]